MVRVTPKSHDFGYRVHSGFPRVKIRYGVALRGEQMSGREGVAWLGSFERRPFPMM